VATIALAPVAASHPRRDAMRCARLLQQQRRCTAAAGIETKMTAKALTAAGKHSQECRRASQLALERNKEIAIAILIKYRHHHELQLANFTLIFRRPWPPFNKSRHTVD